MPRDFFDPTPEQQNVTLIDAVTLRKAERLIESPANIAILTMRTSLLIGFSTALPDQIRR
jgi:hypothetical protein